MKTGLSISNLYYCRSEVHWGTRMSIAPKQVKVQNKLRQLYLHFEGNRPLFVPVPLFFWYTHMAHWPRAFNDNSVKAAFVLTPYSSLLTQCHIFDSYPFFTYHRFGQDHLDHKIDFRQTTEAQFENGYTSTYAPPKWRRYRSLCPHARDIRCKSIIPPKISLTQRRIKANVVESPSCGTGEIPDSKRYSHYPLEL